MKRLLTYLFAATLLTSSCSKPKQKVFNSVVNYYLSPDSIVQKAYPLDDNSPFEALLAYHNGHIDAFTIYNGPKKSILHNLSQTPNFDEYSLSIRKNKVFFASDKGSGVSLFVASVPTKGSASVINISKYFNLPKRDFTVGNFTYHLQRHILGLFDGSKFITDDYVLDTPSFSLKK